MYKLFASILVVNSSKGRGGGPLITAPTIIEVTVVAGADVMLQIGVPGHSTAQMGANIGKHSHPIFALAYNEHAVTVDRLLPSVDGGAREVEGDGNAYRIVA